MDFCNNTAAYKLQKEELNEAITPFVIHFVLQNVGLYWIFEKTKHLNFGIEEHFDKSI